MELRQRVSSLVALDLKSGAVSTDQAAIWKQNLRQIIGAGSQAVPAIRELLARNEDIDLRALPGGKQLGYDTTRQALFGALTQIGGSSPRRCSWTPCIATAKRKESLASFVVAQVACPPAGREGRMFVACQEFSDRGNRL